MHAVPRSDTDRNVGQSAYRVVVTAASTGKIVWDTGKRISNGTRLHAYNGTDDLHSDTLYSWQVQSWDGNGNMATSAAALFRTGLFTRADWLGASWITPGFGRSLLRSPVLNVSGTVTEATVYVAGVGYFELTVNGRRVGEGRKYDVANTPYAVRVNYVSFDLAPFLVPGDNVLGVELGNSWFAEAGWYQDPPYMGCSTAASPGRHGQGEGTCNGGGFSYNVPNQLILSTRVVTSGGGNPLTLNSGAGQGWMAGVGPVTFDSIYDGERYDARLEQPGWDTPSFQPTPSLNWTAAQAVADSSNPLVNATLSSQLYEPIRVIEAQTAVSRWVSNNGTYIFDFGTNMVGVIRLTIQNPVAGRTVTLKHAEVLMHPPYGPKDGSLYYGSLRNAKSTDT